MGISNMEDISTHQEVFYESAEFWVGFAFIMVVALLYSPISKAIKNLINQRIERVKNTLQSAETLKLEAQDLYAKYERKFLNTENEVAEILENQQKIIEQEKNKKIRELNKQLKRKTNEANAHIERAFEKASAEINNYICTKTLVILNKIIRLKLTKSDYSTLIDKSISHIENLEFNEKWIK